MIPTDRCSRKRFTTRVIVSLSRSLRPQLTVPYSEYECLNQWASTFWTVGLYSNQVRGPWVHTTPHFFRCHPNLDDEVNHNIVESEIEGGAFLDDLPAPTTLQIQTQHRWYTVVHRGQGEAWISGHPAFCPEPVLVRIEGSSWGGSMLKIRFVGRGMHLEFRHPSYRTPIVTSRILEIRQCEQSEWEMTTAEYETHPTN